MELLFDHVVVGGIVGVVFGEVVRVVGTTVADRGVDGLDDEREEWFVVASVGGAQLFDEHKLVVLVGEVVVGVKKLIWCLIYLHH